jgi:hypothetical protein
MKKIGITQSGTVIVEMSAVQYDALARLQEDKAIDSPPEPKTSDGKAASAMTLKERLEYIKPRLLKLKNPKTKPAVVKSIEAMHKAIGEVKGTEMDRIILALEKEGFFRIDDKGKVVYL